MWSWATIHILFTVIPSNLVLYLFRQNKTTFQNNAWFKDIEVFKTRKVKGHVSLLKSFGKRSTSSRAGGGIENMTDIYIRKPQMSIELIVELNRKVMWAEMLCCCSKGKIDDLWTAGFRKWHLTDVLEVLVFEGAAILL